MKAKHHIRKGAPMDPTKPVGPQNPWVDPPTQRPRPLEDLYPATQPRCMPLYVGIKSLLAEGRL